MHYSDYIDQEEPKKKRPWFLRWLAPHDASDRKRLILRCSCGRVMWSDAPQKIKRLHDGHMCRVCEKGSFVEFVKMKFNLLNVLTLEERWQLFFQKRGWK